MGGGERGKLTSLPEKGNSIELTRQGKLSGGRRHVAAIRGKRINNRKPG